MQKNLDTQNDINNTLVNLYIQGRSGKMGQLIAKYANDYGFQLVLKIEDAKMIIDFSHHESITYLLSSNIKDKAILIGVTGAPDYDLYLQKINILAANNAVFYSSNLSSGIYIFSEVLKYYLQITKAKMKEMQENPLIIDTHHEQKQDAPSGTAKMLTKLFKDPKIKSIKDPEIKSIREKDEVGIHEVIFTNEFEEISFKHKAKDRAIFAISALKISNWLLKQQIGFYEIRNFME